MHDLEQNTQIFNCYEQWFLIRSPKINVSGLHFSRNYSVIPWSLEFFFLIEVIIFHNLEKLN